MQKLLLSLLFVMHSLVSLAQSLYLKTFGNKQDTPILFLHGGPGGCSIDFEVLAAQNLANKGFFVIVYDRRGEGRSEEKEALYNFEQTFSDINTIYHQFNLKSITLLGHSFGGVVAAKFATQNPQKVKNIVLIGAPVDLQMTFKAILQNVETKLATPKDSSIIKQLNFVKKQDSSSIYYSSGAFMLAMQNGLYNTKTPDSCTTKNYAALANNEQAKAYFQNLIKTNYKNMYGSSMGFYKNEKYTTISVTEEIQNLEGIPIFGIYGKEDGLFDSKQINLIKTLTQEFVFLENCSHNPFIDRQNDSINALIKWLK